MLASLVGLFAVINLLLFGVTAPDDRVPTAFCYWRSQIVPILRGHVSRVHDPHGLKQIQRDAKSSIWTPPFPSTSHILARIHAQSTG
ncbi:hypothetical protein B0H16DRAFT_1543828 [Mycena metata]|uniref:Secreted protein n=1 Tax=Mycena metata TaxID=1033252 RepID=A0AAD7NAL0_9AGAR|nr:hypothetical protein B0H16DRAFT_1543828 [Mycena metata]